MRDFGEKLTQRLIRARGAYVALRPALAALVDHLCPAWRPSAWLRNLARIADVKLTDHAVQNTTGCETRHQAAQSRINMKAITVA